MSATKTIDEVTRAIEDLDLEPLLVKLTDPDGDNAWSLEYARHVEKWYRRFLLLSFKYRGRSIVVNDAIDTFWHCHILDTEKYADDCQRVFGYFLHHFPYFGLRGDQDARNLQQCYSETMRLIADQFGEDLELAFGSRWELQNRPARTGEPRFKGASCSDCDHYIPDQGDGREVFLRDRPRLSGAAAT